MQKQIFSGKSLDEALDMAAKTFQTERSFITYNMLPASKEGGLLSRLFQRTVKVEAWVEHQPEDLQEAARAAVRQAIQKDHLKPAIAKPSGVASIPGPKPIKPLMPRNQIQSPPHAKSQLNSTQQVKKSGGPERQKTVTERAPFDNRSMPQPPLSRLPMRTSEQPSENGSSEKYPPREPGLDFSAPGAVESLQNFSELFCKAFEVETSQLKVFQNAKHDAFVNIDDVFVESLLQKTDRLSLAFEHLFKRLAQKDLGDISSRITLDSLDASKHRDEALHAMALSMADKVRESGKSITLVSRSPLERRAVHLALDGAEGVATRSVGTGDHRKLVIYSTTRAENTEVRNKGPRNQNGAQQQRKRAPQSQGNTHQVRSHGASQNTQNPLGAEDNVSSTLSENSSPRPQNFKRRKRKPTGPRIESNPTNQEN
jgi:spoIIIJ-associated protein